MHLLAEFKCPKVLQSHFGSDTYTTRQDNKTNFGQSKDGLSPWIYFPNQCNYMGFHPAALDATSLRAKLIYSTFLKITPSNISNK